MISAIIELKVKEERLEEYLEIISMLTKETLGKRKGCVIYSFNQSLDNKTEFILHEQWESQKDLDTHIEYLQVLLGPAKEGEILPEKLMNFYEDAKLNFYNAIS